MVETLARSEASCTGCGRVLWESKYVLMGDGQCVGLDVPIAWLHCRCGDFGLSVKRWDEVVEDV